VPTQPVIGLLSAPVYRRRRDLLGRRGLPSHERRRASVTDSARRHKVGWPSRRSWTGRDRCRRPRRSASPPRRSRTVAVASSAALASCYAAVTDDASFWSKTCRRRSVPSLRSAAAITVSRAGGDPASPRRWSSSPNCSPPKPPSCSVVPATSELLTRMCTPAGQDPGPCLRASSSESPTTATSIVRVLAQRVIAGTLIRGGSQRAADATSVSGGNAAGQRLVSSAERSCRQRIALTLSTVGVFPMTHHVECVALLTR
jgi:hypothetical protein